MATNPSTGVGTTTNGVGLPATDLSKSSSSISETVNSDTTIVPSASTNSTTATGPTLATPATSLSTVSSPATSISPSQSSSNVQQVSPTTSPHRRTSSTLVPTSQPDGSTHPSDQLSNGAVAGIVIGAALGLALITFLATFTIMRRQQYFRKKKRSRLPEVSHLGSRRHQGPSGASGACENFLPQSADDTTIQQKVKSTLDQIELHVENFYRNSSSASRPDNVELAKFDSPYLSASLNSLLPRSRNNVNIIKHALAQSVTASISTTVRSTGSLLPTEFTLLPNTITSARSSVTLKPGFAQTVSQWRVMTAYLRPDPTKDSNFIAQRKRQISETVQSFAKAFAPWKSTGYKDEERARSLSAILEDAASLGIFLFSQSSTLEFHWPAAGEMRPGKVVVSPALLKTADEKGGDLEHPLVMVNQEVRDA